MRCGEVARLGNRLQLGQSETAPPVDASEAALLEELARTGLVHSFADGDGQLEEFHQKQRELADLVARYPKGGDKSVRATIADRRRDILELAERVARVESSLDVGGRRYALTYRGRTLLSNILSRLPRVEDMEVLAFERELEALRRSFDARAERAKAVFVRLKQELRDSPEADLRAVAIGLSAREEPAQDLEAAFRDASKALVEAGVPQEKTGTLAECLVVARGPQDASGLAAAVEELVQLRSKVSEVFDLASNASALTPASLLFPLDAARRATVLEDAATIRQILAATGTKPTALAPIFLVAAADLLRATGAITRFERMCDELAGRRCLRAEAEMAAALLVTSKRDPANVLRYFEVARDYLSRFSPAGMAVPAAMLSVLEMTVEESLDDLRLAAASIAAKGLSPGGIENLSLGLKLLVQAAILVSSPDGSGRALQLGPDEAAAPSPIGLSGLALVVPAALTVVAAFHEVTVHRYATSEEAYHPVHTHFIYG